MSEKSGWDLETLSKLCSLWRSGENDYSQEFLADIICTDLARQCRFEEDEAGVKDTLELLSTDQSLSKSALEHIYTKDLFKAVLGFVRRISQRGFREGDWEYEYELADEGHRLLCDYDSLDLLFATLSISPLSILGRIKFAKEKVWFFLTTLILKRYFYVFWNASLMAEGYVQYWKVEDKSPLSLVAQMAKLPEGTTYEGFVNSL